MIRDVPSGARFSFPAEPAAFSFPLNRMGRAAAPHRRIGAAGVATAFNPISAGISAGVGLASTALAGWMNSIQLSHNAMTATTLIVNGLESQLKNLTAAYLAERNPSCADQRAALNAYDQSILWLQSPAACGNPNYGHAGNACISDRVGDGARFPWAQYYRDPIANDPRMAGKNCDTGQEVILPSLTTGTYGDTGLTSTGGSSGSGETAEEIAAAAARAAGATGNTAAFPLTGSISPESLAVIGVGLLGLFLIVREL